MGKRTPERRGRLSSNSSAPFPICLSASSRCRRVERDTPSVCARVLSEASEGLNPRPFIECSRHQRGMAAAARAKSSTPPGRRTQQGISTSPPCGARTVTLYPSLMRTQREAYRKPHPIVIKRVLTHRYGSRWSNHDHRLRSTPAHHALCRKSCCRLS